MKNALCLISITGLASVASAQSGSLSVVASASTIDTTFGSATITLAVYGDADFGTAVAGGEFAIDGTKSVDGSVLDMTGAAAAWGALGEQDNGYAGGGSYNGLIFGQLIFPPFINPAAESMLGNGAGVLLGNVTVTIAEQTCGVWDWTLAAGDGPFVLEIFTDNGAEGEFTQLTSADISFGSASIQVIPAPSSLALLSVGGLAMTRRRR